MTVHTVVQHCSYVPFMLFASIEEKPVSAVNNTSTSASDAERLRHQQSITRRVFLLSGLQPQVIHLRVSHLVLCEFRIE